MLSRTYTVKELPNGLPFLAIDFEEKGFAVLASFLNNEVDDFPQEILAGLEEVLDGRKKSDYFYGNLIAVEYDSSFVSIYHQLEEQPMPLVMATDIFHKLCQEFCRVKADLFKKEFSYPLLLADGKWFDGASESNGF